MLKRFLKDMLIYLPSQILPGITAFITTPILTRIFPPAEYGYWALIASISAFLVALGVSGFGSAAIRFYPAYKAESTLEIFFATLSISMLTVVFLVTGASVLALFFLRGFLPTPLIQLLPLAILIFIVQSIFLVFMAVVRAQGRSGSYTSIQLFSNYGGLGLGLLLVVALDIRINGLLWGTFLAVALSLPFLIFQATKQVGIHLKHFRISDALQFWQYAWPLTLGNVAMWGLRVSDLFIISSFSPERDVGLYSVSYNISAKSIDLLVALFLLGASPLVYSSWESKGQAAAEETLTMITRVYLLLCLPAAFGLTVLAYPFVALLASPEYHEGAKIVGFVVFSSLAWGLSDIALTGLLIKKHARQLGANQLIAVSVHIGLQLILVPRFGYIAAAVTTLIGYSILFLLNTVTSRPHLTWRFPFDTLRNVIAASCVMGLVTWGVYGMSGNGHQSSPVFLFLSIVAAVLTYAACLWFLGEIKKEEKHAVWQLWYGTKGEEHV